MARPPYTKLLWQASISTTGATNSPTVPANTEWVVRDMVVFGQGQIYGSMNGFSIFTGSGFPVWGVGGGKFEALKYYQWDGRQVITTGDNLTFYCSDTAYQLRVTGYVFLLS